MLARLRASVEALYGEKRASADPFVHWGYEHHVLVVARAAGELSKRFRADEELAVAGALLHDIADAVMDREDPAHERECRAIAARLLAQAGYGARETVEVIERIIAPHSCKELLPQTHEAKILATADAVAHLTTDFYLYFCWAHFGASDFAGFKRWVCAKIERDFSRKIAFDEVRAAVRPRYEALRTLFEGH